MHSTHQSLEVPVSPRQRRSSARRADRERRLIDAALSCVSTLGLSATTVQAVAVRAGMANGSINQYFRSKDQLLTAVLHHLSHEFESTWQAALSAAGTDPAERLAAFVRAYFEPATCQRRKVAVWFAFWGEVKARPHYRSVCEAYDRRHDAMLEALCAALLEADADGARRPAALAKLVASVCYGLWLELLTGSREFDRVALASLAADALASHFPAHAAAFRKLLAAKRHTQ